MMEYIACSCKGVKKEQNEDRIMVNNTVISFGRIYGKEKKELIAIICDGVGSTKGAAKAAEIFASSFDTYDLKTLTPLTLSQHIYKMNKWIVKEQKRNFCMNMATTVAGLIIIDDRDLVFNLGDTRIYKYYKGNFTCLTEDHSIMNSDNSLGTKTTSITSYIGGEGCSCYPTFRKSTVEIGNNYLLCSDGVYKYTNEEQLKKILSSNQTIEKKARAILKQSLKNGSPDDMSLILINCIC